MGFREGLRPAGNRAPTPVSEEKIRYSAASPHLKRVRHMRAYLEHDESRVLAPCWIRHGMRQRGAGALRLNGQLVEVNSALVRRINTPNASRMS